MCSKRILWILSYCTCESWFHFLPNRQYLQIFWCITLAHVENVSEMLWKNKSHYQTIIVEIYIKVSCDKSLNDWNNLNFYNSHFIMRLQTWFCTYLNFFTVLSNFCTVLTEWIFVAIASRNLLSVAIMHQNAAVWRTVDVLFLNNFSATFSYSGFRGLVSWSLQRRSKAYS